MRKVIWDWLCSGGRLDSGHDHGHPHQHPWHSVLWLTGVDYFSTLGYQPGLALLAAGAIAPLATLVLVIVTLTCALPVYAQVARRSYAGQGSIAMLEDLLPGWWGKILVLALLGFAATDFVITMTLSAADAAQHAIENPLLEHIVGHAQVEITLALLLLLALVFLKGFKEAIGVARLIAVPYLGLSLVILIRCLWEIIHHPELLPSWKRLLVAKGDPSDLVLASILLFPSLALGLSGFETGVSVMPLVKGEPEDHERAVPRGRIRNTRKLLMTAALIMSVFLILSSFSTTLLIPEEEYVKGGKAYGRAIAYLAHLYLGPVFGTVYDLCTIMILWFAGASAMAGLLHLIPRFLPRFGMAPGWVAYARPLVIVLFLITTIVTLVFHADVEKQGGAYATGVLALMLSAAVASALALKRDGNRIASFFGWVIAAVFLYTLLDNIHTRPDGLIISMIFIAVVLAVSGFSRYWRATELRVASVEYVDEESEKLWNEMIGKKISLVPLRYHSPSSRASKERDIRAYYTVSGPLAFLNVRLLNNRSEFFAPLRIRVRREGDNYVVGCTQAIAVANTIAYVSELLDPISIFLGLTRRNLMSQAFNFLLWGEGETGMMVYTILLKYWEETPEDDVRPLIFLMSE